LAEDAKVIAGNRVELVVHLSKYVRDVGEQYTTPMSIFVAPYSKGKNKDCPLDIKPFTKGKPVMLTYALTDAKNGFAMPIVMPSNASLAYFSIQEGNKPHTSEDAEPKEDNSDCPF
jgi:hypothetical protein